LAAFAFLVAAFLAVAIVCSLRMNRRNVHPFDMAPTKRVRPISNGTSVQSAQHPARYESNLRNSSIQALFPV
jgi:HAMP domain-containing protein